MSGYYGRKPLWESVSRSELLELRAEGLTNKQIAQRIGVSPSTIYKYIGKMSRSVKAAEEQNKPCPVNKDLSGYYREEYDEQFVKPVEIPETNEVVEEEEKPVVNTQEHGTLRIIREVRILDLDGILCNYHVDPLSGDIEFRGDVINGLLDKASLKSFIDELVEISKMMEV